MLPLSLSLAQLRLVLIGSGTAAIRRLAWLEEAGACEIAVFSAAPSPALASAAGSRLRARWPEPQDLEAAQLVFIADVPEPERTGLARAARAAGVIIHAEDAPALGDFHAPAVLRRGPLTIAISTEGASPGLAAELKGFLGTVIGPEWDERSERLRALRRGWRRQGATQADTRRLTAAVIARNGWLKTRCPLAANDRGAGTKERERGGTHGSETR